MTKFMPLRAHFLILLFSPLLFIKPAFAGFPDDFSDVTWIDPDISSWPITASLNVNVSGANLIVNHSKKSSWPIRGIIGNSTPCCNTSVWVFAQNGGRWYASTFEYLRPGQTVKQAKTVSGTYIKRPPFLASGVNWKPSNGEVIGFMVSGLARFSLSNVNIRERSGVFLYRWGVGPIGMAGQVPVEPPEPEAPPVPSHEYTGDITGILSVTGGAINGDSEYSEPITVVVSDDRKVVFTVDGESFTTEVARNNRFDGKYTFNFLGACEVRIDVSGLVAKRVMRGYAEGSSSCQGSQLSLYAQFNAGSDSEPEYLDGVRPVGIGTFLRMLLAEEEESVAPPE